MLEGDSINLMVQHNLRLIMKCLIYKRLLVKDRNLYILM